MKIINYLMLVLTISLIYSCQQISLPTIVYQNSSGTEQPSAQEIRRYLYLRTGKLALIQEIASAEEIPAYAIVLTKNDGVLHKADVELGPESYQLKTDGNRLFITGGSDKSLLYGSYKFAEHLGIRFYLHGDVIPDKRLKSFTLPVLNEVHTPLFATRGIQPFHDFPEGPDWWTLNEYKAILAQLPKMGMNFIGFHNYPHPEPMVWIGLKSDIDSAGNVKAAYPARHFHTMENGWGYAAKSTGDYFFGAANWYPKDIYGPVYMDNRTATTYTSGQWGTSTTDEQTSIDLFNASGKFFSEAFTYAHKMGVKICLGTETPLGIPAKVKEHLQQMNLNPADSSVVRQLYEGVFTWVQKHYPADYYWLWTDETWTWSGNTQQQLDAVMSDMQIALRALDNVKPGFGLATCGWVLGPQQDRSLFDNYLPKNIPFSCINRNVGFTPIDPGFVAVNGRSKWAIPWMEDDPALILPQLWVGRMQRDAADALAYGCDGLIGIHWRTQSIAQNISALAQAGWSQTEWNPNQDKKMTQEEAVENSNKQERDLGASSYYAGWAHSEFGEEAAEQLAVLFTNLDGTEPSERQNERQGRLPRQAVWVDGPGGLKASYAKVPTAWVEVVKDYAFVDEMEALRPLIKGNGNIARFDYWLNTFRYLRVVGELNCTIGAYNQKVKEIRQIKEPQKQQEQAKNELLPLRIQSIQQLREIHRHLFAFINTYGELGNLTNWQQHLMDLYFDKPAKELTSLLGTELPAEALPDKVPVYSSRIIAPELRTAIDRGESFNMQVIITEISPAKAVLKYRMLGEKKYQTIALQTVGRCVYQADIPANSLTGDFEYYIEVEKQSSGTMRFPATAPALNQTVAIW
ncbi:hypothetical protein EZS27_002297 [termite gut metagenome]|uniref:Alpha glucuronidase N-terminal domain-containing protein n=1 Tax=termite gut metagenome TaxID=433724 RepID=A0A5J4SXX2_9ZZZZ